MKTIRSALCSKGETACLIVPLCGLLILFLFILFSNKGPTYDEPGWLSTITKLDQSGLTLQFIRDYPDSAAPLSVFVQLLAKPLTHLRPPGIRLVNFSLLIILIIGLVLFLRLQESTHALCSALGIVAAPMAWVMGGMALSEMSAMVCCTFAIFLLFLALQHRFPRPARLWVAATGGLLLGLAIAGRQPFLLVLLAVPLLLAHRDTDFTTILVFALAGAVLPAILFSIWGGLTSPSARQNIEGIAICYGLLAFGYAAVLMLIWAPGFLYVDKTVIALLIGTVALNLTFGFSEHSALHTIAEMLFSEVVLKLYARLVAGVMISLGLLFVISTFKRMWDNRHDALYLFLCTSAILVLAAAAKITHQFSSRYVGTAIPLLVPVAEKYVQCDLLRALSMTLGSAIGLLSLWSYFGGS